MPQADSHAAATKEQLTYQGFLSELLLAEVDDRDRRSPLRRIKSGGFPREKWLADFDFDQNPSISPATINEFATGDWIRRNRYGWVDLLVIDEWATWSLTGEGPSCCSGS